MPRTASCVYAEQGNTRAVESAAGNIGSVTLAKQLRAAVYCQANIAKATSTPRTQGLSQQRTSDPIITHGLEGAEGQHT